MPTPYVTARLRELEISLNELRKLAGNIETGTDPRGAAAVATMMIGHLISAKTNLLSVRAHLLDLAVNGPKK